MASARDLWFKQRTHAWAKRSVLVHIFIESVRIVCGRVLYFIVAVLLSYLDKFDTFFPLVRDDHRFRLIYFEPEEHANLLSCSL